MQINDERIKKTFLGMEHIASLCFKYGVLGGFGFLVAQFYLDTKEETKSRQAQYINQQTELQKISANTSIMANTMAYLREALKDGKLRDDNQDLLIKNIDNRLIIVETKIER